MPAGDTVRLTTATAMFERSRRCNGALRIERESGTHSERYVALGSPVANLDPSVAGCWRGARSLPEGTHATMGLVGETRCSLLESDFPSVKSGSPWRRTDL
jgi:hypothetical protein